MTKKIEFPYEPHRGCTEPHRFFPGGQLLILQKCLEYQIVMAMFGRSFGKTLMDPLLFREEGARCTHRYQFAYAAPTFRLAKEQYRFWKKIFEPLLGSDYGLTKGFSDSDLILHTRPFGANQGGEAHFWGLDQHDLLRGFRKDRIAVDEGKDAPEEAVFATLMPMLLGREGKMFVKGTPSRFGIGAHWMKNLFLRGQDTEDPKNAHIFSMRAPSHANPYLTDQEIANMIASCEDENMVKEEVYAEILEDDASVFTNLRAVFSVPVLKQVHKNHWIGEEPDEGEPYESEEQPGRQPDRYVLGWDIGRSASGDPSIASVFNLRTRRQAALLRMPGLPFPAQLEEISRLRARYHNATIHYDATGIGGAFFDELARRYGDGAVPHKWNVATKEADITRGRFLCARAGDEEHGPGWQLLDIPFQKTEFEAYSIITTKRDGTPLHTPRYEAPRGLHDDTVAAALICSEHLTNAFSSQLRAKKKPPALWRATREGVSIAGSWLNDWIKKDKKVRSREEGRP